MTWVSTGGESVAPSLGAAVFSSLAPDGGLWTPETLQPLPPSVTADLYSMSLPQVGLRVASHLIGDEIGEDALAGILPDALDFDIPLVEVDPGIYALELFHGPTLAFKDVGARFLARLMRYLINERGEDLDLPEGPLTILVATSGDTGSAVAHAFWRVPGIEVKVLYPSGQVSEAQRKLFSTLGENVDSLAVAGTFDDCQRLVKAAFSDETLRRSMALASANSINIGRLLPQIFYYFHARAQLLRQVPDAAERPLRIATPSGNFGNLTAGLFARALGLPVERFIAATNRNDVVPTYLETGTYLPRPSMPTLSNAMDVGDPSNFARMRHLYGGSVEALRSDLDGATFSDQQTTAAMREVHERTGYVLDPHSAVGYLGLLASLDRRPGALGIFLATAHPAKFQDTVEKTIGQPISVPRAIAQALAGEESVTEVPAEYAEFASYLWADLEKAE